MKKLILTLLTLPILMLISCSNNDDNMSSEKDITHFKILEYDGKINLTENTISITVPFDVDLKSVQPFITLSAGASVMPASGEIVDLSSPKEYVVTAENGDTKKYIITAQNVTFFITNTNVEIKDELILFGQFREGTKYIRLKNLSNGNKFTLDISRESESQIHTFIKDDIEEGEYELSLEINSKEMTYLEPIKVSKSTAPLLYELDEFTHEYKGTDFVIKGENLRKENAKTEIFFYRKGDYEFPHILGDAKFDKDGNILVENSKIDFDLQEYCIQVKVEGRMSNRIFFKIVDFGPIPVLKSVEYVGDDFSPSLYLIEASNFKHEGVEVWVECYQQLSQGEKFIRNCQILGLTDSSLKVNTGIFDENIDKIKLRLRLGKQFSEFSKVFDAPRKM